MGLASSGQLGSGKKTDYLTPMQISLGDPPTDFKPPNSAPAVYSGGEGMDLGTSVDPDDTAESAESKRGGVGAKGRGFGRRYRLKRVFAGGDQTFAAVETSHGDEVRGERGCGQVEKGACP